MLISISMMLTILVASLWARWDEDKSSEVSDNKARDKTVEYLESVAPNN